MIEYLVRENDDYGCCNLISSVYWKINGISKFKIVIYCIPIWVTIKDWSTEYDFSSVIIIRCRGVP